MAQFKSDCRQIQPSGKQGIQNLVRLFTGIWYLFVRLQQVILSCAPFFTAVSRGLAGLGAFINTLDRGLRNLHWTVSRLTAPLVNCGRTLNRITSGFQRFWVTVFTGSQGVHEGAPAPPEGVVDYMDSNLQNSQEMALRKR